VLAECGGICKGICIDVGCGPGHLDVELERRSDFTIIGLDINRDMKPLFEKRMREAGLQERMSFVVGDAQKMPFPTDVTSTRRKSTRSRRRS
jgi:ubiquinone/menaquinone biosynthesis C-methylase UbiE